MFKRQTLVRSAVISAVFSTLLVAIPAQAGLLGGGPSVVGGLAGSAAGGFGPGGANVGGMGMVQGAFSNSNSMFPSRGERAIQSTRQVTAESQTAGQGAVTKGNTVAEGNATGASQAARDTPSTASRNSAPLNTVASASGNGEARATKPLATTNAAPAPSSNRSAQLSVIGTGSAQGSHEGAQARGDASGQGSMGR